MIHTKAPWKISDTNRITIVEAELDEGREKPVAVMFARPLCGRSHDDAHGIAERIIDCVNACEGIEDPAVIPELLHVLIEALPYVEMAEDDPAYKKGAVRKMVSKMRNVIDKAAQRDELLAALRECEEAARHRDNTMGDPCRLIECKARLEAAAAQAREVIAKATELEELPGGDLRDHAEELANQELLNEE